MPSLDAGNQNDFNLVNRPHVEVTFGRMIEGLIRFRDEFPREIRLEVMLVGGVNDSDESLESIRNAAARIRPDRLQLNTVTRIPAQNDAFKIDAHRMHEIRRKFGENAEIIADYPATEETGELRETREEIKGMLARRPCSLDDLAAALGVNRHEVAKALERMVEEGVIGKAFWGGKTMYRALT